jgi:Uma2 family endonuclease
VSQTERRVELYRRIGEGTWQLTEQVGEGAIRLASIDVELRLAEVYEKVELPVAASEAVR